MDVINQQYIYKYKTEEEYFWAGEFGSGYIERNNSDQLVASNLKLFSDSLDKIYFINSVIEFGANIGLNLKALKLIYPEQQQYAIEINSDAVKVLPESIPVGNIFNDSILNYNSTIKAELALIKGVLIHINPLMLNDVYDKIYSSSSKYILMCEYYNPYPIEIDYRGHSGKLYKRDFAGEFLDRFSDVKLIDYGFTYRKDKSFTMDDLNWFLMSKD